MNVEPDASSLASKSRPIRKPKIGWPVAFRIAAPIAQNASVAMAISIVARKIAPRAVLAHTMPETYMPMPARISSAPPARRIMSTMDGSPMAAQRTCWREFVTLASFK